MNLYTILDVETMTYNPPFLEAKDSVAMRAFRQAVQKHPIPGLSVRLIRIGMFDDATGDITPCPHEVLFSATTGAQDA